MSYGGTSEAERLRALTEPQLELDDIVAPDEWPLSEETIEAIADTFTARKRAHPGEERWR